MPRPCPPRPLVTDGGPATAGRLSRRGLLAAGAAGLAAAAMAPGRVAAAVETRDAISHHGVTFRFAEPRPVGRYATGDWFVLAPVTVVEISPASVRTADPTWNYWSDRPARTVHGAQLDWHPEDRRMQGLDDVLWDHNPQNRHDPEANVDPGITGRPLRLDRPVTVIKGVSRRAADLDRNLRPCLEALVFLTVVDEIPPEGAFRPPAEPGDKRSRWTEADLDWSILPRLPAPPGMTHRWDLAGMGARALFPHWNSHSRFDMNRQMMAAANQPSYGREHAWMTGHAGLALCADAPDAAKRDLFVGLVQQGIDLAALVARRPIKAADGNSHGRALPLALAAAALGDQDLRAAASGRNFTASEHGQFFFVGDDVIGRDRFDRDRPRGPYTEDMRGLPEFGGQHLRHGSGAPMQPERSGSHFGMSYRNIVSNPLVAAAAAAHAIRGVAEAWDQPAFFAYMDGWTAITRYQSDGDASHLRAGNGPGAVALACFRAWRGRSPVPVHRARPEPMTLTRVDRGLRLAVTQGAPRLVPLVGGFEVHPVLNPDRDSSLDATSIFQVRLSPDGETWAIAGEVPFGASGRVEGLARRTRHFVQMRQVHPDHGAGPWSFDWVWWAEGLVCEGRRAVAAESWEPVEALGPPPAMFDWLARMHRREATRIEIRTRQPRRGREDRISAWTAPFWLHPDLDFVPPGAGAGGLRRNAAHPPSVVTL